MKKIIGVLTARMTSTRLPGKVLKTIYGKSMFAHHVERMSTVKGLDSIFLATSKNPLNYLLIEEAETLGCGYYAGEEEDIIERHIHICEQESADAVIRVTCDCPLFDIEITSKFVSTFRHSSYDFVYCSNMPMHQGTLGELISYDALREVHKTYRGPAISLPIREHLNAFKTVGIPLDNQLVRPEYRLTVDEPNDMELIKHIYNALYQGYPIDLKDVYRWLDDNPEIAALNQSVMMKGVNKFSANLMESPLFSIIRSGEHYIIVDENKRKISPENFLTIFKKMFPYIHDYENIEDGNLPK